MKNKLHAPPFAKKPIKQYDPFPSRGRFKNSNSGLEF